MNEFITESKSVTTNDLSFNSNKKKLILFGSCTTDWGTKSITEAYVRMLSPAITIRLNKGLKHMGLLKILQWWIFLFKHRKSDITIVSLHRAPTLIVGLFPLPRRGRWITILESNESCPYGLNGLTRVMYDAVYRYAFSRLDAVYSPFLPFREYYGSQGVNVNSCLYPLPYPVDSANDWQPSEKIRILFIGADYKRKGGDLLLNYWQKSRPANAELTFVCPDPPTTNTQGVIFLTDIKIGTVAHRELLTCHDVMILPTFQDPFGFALLEAINFGICTITTEHAGAAEIVRNAGGIVADNPEESIKALDKLCETPNEINLRRHKCREFLVQYEAELLNSFEKMI